MLIQLALSNCCVTIDPDLNFSEHINTICKKASQKIGVLMRLRNLIPTNAKLVLFNNSNIATPYILPPSVALLQSQ